VKTRGPVILHPVARLVRVTDPAGDRAIWRERLRVIIFEADTPLGKAFDVALLVAIVLSVAAVMIESVDSYRRDYGRLLYAIEWVFTLLFTLEYLARLVCVRQPLRYARSFFGVVDLLAILPTYLSVLLPGAQSMLVIRGLRLLRIFRVFKLGQFLGEASMLRESLEASRRKILIFLGTILILVTILGTAMYLIEGRASGFDDIPTAVYWSIVTMTTVGYGDITPVTPLGKALAAFVMVLGYSILAVPTGIVTAEILETARRELQPTTRSCPHCTTDGHRLGARFCEDCGGELAPP
jgi:voltage-gated potassium channel